MYKLGLTLGSHQNQWRGNIPYPGTKYLAFQWMHGLAGWPQVRDLISFSDRELGLISLIHKLRLLTLFPNGTQLVNSLFITPFFPERQAPLTICLFFYFHSELPFKSWPERQGKEGPWLPPLWIPQPSSWDLQGQHEIFKSSNWNPVSARSWKAKFSSPRTSVSVCWCHLGTLAFQTIDWTFLSIQHF